MRFPYLLVNETIIKTQKKQFPYDLSQGKGYFLDFCTVAVWLNVSAVVTSCDQAHQLHRHLQTDVCSIYRKPDILIQTSIFPTHAFLRGYLIDISLANITLHVHILIYTMALNSHVL